MKELIAGEKINVLAFYTSWSGSKFVMYGSFKHHGSNDNSFPMSKGSVQNCTKYTIDAYFTISALCYTTLQSSCCHTVLDAFFVSLHNEYYVLYCDCKVEPIHRRSIRTKICLSD